MFFPFDIQFHVYKNHIVQIKKKNGNIWEYNVRINIIIVIIANCVCKNIDSNLAKTSICTNPIVQGLPGHWAWEIFNKTLTCTDRVTVREPLPQWVMWSARTATPGRFTSHRMKWGEQTYYLTIILPNIAWKWRQFSLCPPPPDPPLSAIECTSFNPYISGWFLVFVAKFNGLFGS